jgi:hypothetical protein
VGNWAFYYRYLSEAGVTLYLTGSHFCDKAIIQFDFSRPEWWWQFLFPGQTFPGSPFLSKLDLEHVKSGTDKPIVDLAGLFYWDTDFQ